MNTRAKLVGSVVMMAFAFAAGWFIWPAAQAPLPKPPAVVRTESGPEPAAVLPLRADPPKTSNAPASLPPSQPVQPRPAEPLPPPDELNERTLVGTKWERDGFRLEFGADGKLLISGSERAKWRVEGQRIRLYHDTTGEEHWLEIVGDKLLWQGQEIGRAP